VRFWSLKRPSGVMDGVEIEDRLLWPEQVAEMLGLPTGTLANWRYQGRGPAFVKIGRHVRYRRSDVADWIEERVVLAGGQ
jgi:excisionase family DNA binding protein